MFKLSEVLNKNMTLQDRITLFKIRDQCTVANRFKILIKKDKTNYKVWNALDFNFFGSEKYDDANICFKNEPELQSDNEVYKKNAKRLNLEKDECIFFVDDKLASVYRINGN